MRTSHADDGAALRSDALLVRFTPAGGISAVAPSGCEDQPWLSAGGEPTLVVGGRPVVLGRPVVGVDPDEVEVVWATAQPGRRVLVRHDVEATWTVRLTLVNDTGLPWHLDRVTLGWSAPVGCVATGLAAGATATYAVQGKDGRGPVLVGRLRSGEQTQVSAAELVLGPRVLAAGHRWSAQWRWDVVAAPRDVDPSGTLPRTPWLELGQTVLLPGGPDVAVLADGLDVEVEQDQVALTAAFPQTSVVELRSARGTSTYQLTWASALDDLVDDAVALLLAGATTPAGTVRLPSAAAGLLVQDALARGATGAPEACSEALELLAGVLADVAETADPATPPDPFAVALLTREAARTGDVTLLRVATRAVLDASHPVPGLGLATAGVVLALVGTGEAVDTMTPAAVIAHLAGLDGLETALLTRPREGGPDQQIRTDLLRVGASLGAGLPGRVLGAQAPDEVAYAAALLGLVDEPTGQRLRRRWGITPAELARRTSARVRAEVGVDLDAGPETVRALAWLVLGRATVGA